MIRGLFKPYDAPPVLLCAAHGGRIQGGVPWIFSAVSSAVSVSVFGFPSVQGAGGQASALSDCGFRFPVFVVVTAGASDALAGYPDKPPEDVVGASVGTSEGGFWLCVPSGRAVWKG